MFSILFDYSLKSLLFIIPIYFGYNFYQGKYNNFIFSLILNKIKYELIIKEKINNLINYNPDEDLNKDLNKEEIMKEYYIFYNNNSYIYSDTIENYLEEIKNLPFKIYVKELNGKNSIYRIQNIDDFNKEKLPKSLKSPFIQIEIELNDRKVQLDLDHLNEIFYNNNTILDKYFVKWFLSFYKYEVAYNDNYIINIIDDNVNCFTLSNSEYIIISDKFENNYKKVIIEN